VLSEVARKGQDRPKQCETGRNGPKQSKTVQKKGQKKTVETAEFRFGRGATSPIWLMVDG
jgi:hypothetical protein